MRWRWALLFVRFQNLGASVLQAKVRAQLRTVAKTPRRFELVLTSTREGNLSAHLGAILFLFPVFAEVGKGAVKGYFKV